MNELKENLNKENQRMLNLNFYSSERITSLLAYASGYAPDAKISEVYDIIRDIVYGK